MFDPKAHLIQLPRRVKDRATGQYRTVYDDYLEVKWRLVWFRERHPHGRITTEALSLDWEQGLAISYSQNIRTRLAAGGYGLPLPTLRLVSRPLIMDTPRQEGRPRLRRRGDGMETPAGIHHGDRRSGTAVA